MLIKSVNIYEQYIICIQKPITETLLKTIKRNYLLLLSDSNGDLKNLN